MTMQLRSSAFDDGAAIPRRFTREGGDVSPPLNWSDPPAPTRSFVVLCDDPDAPAGTWHHWAAYDIPAGRTGLPEDAARHNGKEGFMQALNDFGRSGYGGPCPPRSHGPHHYHSGCLRSPPTTCGSVRTLRIGMSSARHAGIFLPRRFWLACTSGERRGRNGLVSEIFCINKPSMPLSCMQPFTAAILLHPVEGSR